MNRTITKTFCFATLVGSIVFLPGCLGWLREKFGGSDQSVTASAPASQEQIAGQVASDGSPVLVTMNGQPIITEKNLNEVFEQVLEENPQLKAVLPLMPDAKFNVLQGMVTQAAVDQYIADKKIDQKPEYARELENMTKSVKRMLNARYFSFDHPVTISDSEVKKFYDDNKVSMPGLLISHGGVKAQGISFDKDADAQAFLAKAKGKDLGAVAQEAKIKDKVVDFKLVNAQSLGIDTAVREKIASLKKFPATEVVKGTDGKFWVVNATASEEPKYRPFDQVKEELKQYIEKEKRMEIFDKEVNKLKEQYKIIVNEAFFKSQEAGQSCPPEKMEQLLPAAKSA